MAGVIQQKICIEWILEIPTIVDFTIESDSFIFQDRKCNLQFISGERNEFLCLKSDRKLNSAVNVTVFVTDSQGKQMFHLQRRWIISETAEIWMTVGSRFTVGKFTFVVILNADPSREKEKSSESRKNIHFEALSRDFSKLLDESLSCDVEIACEGKTFNAHRIVLGTRSSVFSAMFNSSMVENETGLVKVEDIGASIFQSFLRYLYSGTLPELNMDTAKQFYEIGDRYAVEELKEACSEFLTENLAEGNACEMLVLADQHSDEDFRKNVVSYIVDKKIPQCDESWFDFCKSHPILAIEVQNIYIDKYCPK